MQKISYGTTTQKCKNEHQGIKYPTNRLTYQLSYENTLISRSPNITFYTYHYTTLNLSMCLISCYKET